MSLEDHIRKIVVDELSKHQPAELVSISQFCKAKNVSRVTVWRAERAGRLKLTRIGRKVFVKTDQFYT
jgi:hypothetical protein